MWKFFQKINQVRPKPLKRLQKILGIEEEWRNFKVLIKPHKFKLASVGLIAVFPIYQLCSQYYYNTMKQKVQERIHETKPLSKVSEDFIKQLVENTLVKDPQIKRESAIYGEHVVKNQEALDQILVLLLDGVKDPRFIHEIKGTLKTVGLGAIKDKVIERNSIDFVVEALKDPEVKNEILDLGKSIPKDEATKKEVIEFCKSTFLDERMQQRVRELATKTTHDVLTDQATKEQLKLFAFFFLENEAENVRESARGFINDIVDKVKKGHRVENKESEVQRVLEERGQEQAFESIHTRKKSASGSKESDEKAPSF